MFWVSGMNIDRPGKPRPTQVDERFIGEMQEPSAFALVYFIDYISDRRYKSSDRGRGYRIRRGYEPDLATFRPVPPGYGIDSGVRPPGSVETYEYPRRSR